MGAGVFTPTKKESNLVKTLVAACLWGRGLGEKSRAALGADEC
jgi:hypothetical protein